MSEFLGTGKFSVHSNVRECAARGCPACSQEIGYVYGLAAESKRLLEAASHALRSYQYGNAATDPAKDVADAIDEFLKTDEPQTLVGKAAL